MRSLMIFAAVLAVTAACPGQEAAKPVSINKVPITYTDPGSGPEMFRAYCAVCHGLDGKGTGPAASALKKPPADLTLLTKKNGGKFPAMDVQSMIQGDAVTGAHGSREMPIWGDLFRSVSADPTVVRIRIRNLRDFIESIQEK